MTDHITFPPVPIMTFQPDDAQYLSYPALSDDDLCMSSSTMRLER